MHDGAGPCGAGGCCAGRKLAIARAQVGVEETSIVVGVVEFHRRRGARIHFQHRPRFLVQQEVDPVQADEAGRRHEGVEADPEIGFDRGGQGDLPDGAAVEVRQAGASRAVALLVEAQDESPPTIGQEERRAGSTRHDALEVGAGAAPGARGLRPAGRGHHPSHRAASPPSRADRQVERTAPRDGGCQADRAEERIARDLERRRRSRGHCRRADAQRPAGTAARCDPRNRNRRPGPPSGSAGRASRRRQAGGDDRSGARAGTRRTGRPTRGRRCRGRRSSREPPPDGRRVRPTRRARGRSRPPRASVPDQSAWGNVGIATS